MLSRPALHEPPPTTPRDSRACLSSKVGNNPALFPGNMAYLPPPACRPRSCSGWLAKPQSPGSRHSENPAAVSPDSFPNRDRPSHYSQNSPEIPKLYLELSGTRDAWKSLTHFSAVEKPSNPFAARYKVPQALLNF